MITDTEGIVLRQVKAPGGRRMITLFSQKFGKISVGTSLNEGGRTKAALAVRAFSYGRYELFKNRESYNLKKLYKEEAIMELELSDKPFVLYRNARRDVLQIVYRRPDGDYSIIELGSSL